LKLIGSEIATGSRSSKHQTGDLGRRPSGLVARGTGSERPLGLAGSGLEDGTRFRLANEYTFANTIGIYQYERWKQQKVEHKPATTYIVSVFDKPHWRTHPVHQPGGRPDALEQAMVQDGANARIEEIAPKPKRR
jgi:hypothetical protein